MKLQFKVSEVENYLHYLKNKVFFFLFVFLVDECLNM